MEERELVASEESEVDASSEERKEEGALEDSSIEEEEERIEDTLLEEGVEQAERASKAKGSKAMRFIDGTIVGCK